MDKPIWQGLVAAFFFTLISTFWIAAVRGTSDDTANWNLAITGVVVLGIVFVTVVLVA